MMAYRKVCLELIYLSTFMQSKSARYLLMFTGWSAVLLGTVGVVIPLLPTTPFILLAGGCFAKSSPRFHQWLINHAFFGAIINSYQNKHGLPRNIKIRAITFIWVTLSISIYFLSITWVRVVIFILGLALTISLWRTPEPGSENSTSTE